MAKTEQECMEHDRTREEIQTTISDLMFKGKTADYPMEIIPNLIRISAAFANYSLENKSEIEEYISDLEKGINKALEDNRVYIKNAKKINLSYMIN